jgi:hypothetical protein
MARPIQSALDGEAIVVALIGHYALYPFMKRLCWLVAAPVFSLGCETHQHIPQDQPAQHWGRWAIRSRISNEFRPQRTQRAAFHAALPLVAKAQPVTILRWK